MIGRIIKGVQEQFHADDQEVSIVVTGDHTTPVKYGDHTFEPVPLAIARVENAYKCLDAASSSDKSSVSDPAVSAATSVSPLVDSVQTFSELSVARGALGRFAGDQLMELIKKFRMYEA